MLTCECKGHRLRKAKVGNSKDLKNYHILTQQKLRKEN
jgi:hypothetical protein